MNPPRPLGGLRGNPNWVKILPEGGNGQPKFLLKKGLDTTPLGNNSWLSGFTSSDRSFEIRTSEHFVGLVVRSPTKSNGTYQHFSTTCTIVQNRTDQEHLESYKSIMQDIAEFFLAELSIQGKQGGWRARNSSQTGSRVIVDYFSTFPLFSSKQLDFEDWRECHLIIESKLHWKKYGVVGSDFIRMKKTSINRKRTHFTWDHLKQFYSR